MEHFEQSVYDLIVETSTNLPADVRRAIRAGAGRESAGTRAALSMGTIAKNITMAEHNVSPICQDTGMPTFMVHTPVGANQMEMKRAIRAAIAKTTKDGKLRTNSVDSLTGGNTGDNLGPGTPVIHFEQWERGDIEIRLILKGGGCENKNIQYSLPAELPGLGKAGRDLDGIRKCIMHAVFQAQGQGCSAGFIGVGIGGDRTTGYELAKHQLFRAADDVNPHDELRRLEEYVMEHANRLGIGTMGFGGEVTLLGCKVGVNNRLPASFFVSVAYNCWAFRRQGVLIDASTGSIREWVYERGKSDSADGYVDGRGGNSGSADKTGSADKSGSGGETGKAGAAAGFGFVGNAEGTGAVKFPDAAVEDGGTDTPREVTLATPLTEEQVRGLKVGDVVILNGRMYTGRDAIHKYLTDHDAPVDLNGAALYHCGPVMLKDDDGWHVKAAGPTTSIREEPYQGDIIRKFGIRAVIGKGGMGPKTLQALRDHGAVYLNAIGGAAQYYAETIKGVDGVDLLEFGIPEAMWHLRVEGFAAIVTMDAHGNSLHADVEKSSLQKLEQFKEPVFR